MNRLGCAAVLAATTALAAVTAEAIPAIVASEAGPSYCYTPYPKHRDMSGITWAGGNKFYVIRNDNHLCVMTVSLDYDGSLKSLPDMTDGIPLEDASDPEGIAYDMAYGKVWVSDETGPSIREFDPVTPPSSKWILNRSGVTHNQVLEVDSEVTRSFSSAYSTSSEDSRMDMVIQIVHSPEGPLGTPTGDPQFVFAANDQGQLCLWHRRGRNGKVISGDWSTLSSTKYNDGAWVTEGCKDGEALWEGVEHDDPSTGAKFYRVEVVEAAAE